MSVNTGARMNRTAMRAAAIPFVLLLLILLPGLAAAQSQPQVTFDKAEIAVETAAGDRHIFEVELALRREQFGQ